jgi:hypothetical protein
LKVTGNSTSLGSYFAPAVVLNLTVGQRLNQVGFLWMQSFASVERRQRGGVRRFDLIFHYNTSVCLVFLMDKTAS